MRNVDISEPDWGAWIEHHPGKPELTEGMIFQPILSLLHWDQPVSTHPSVASRRSLDFDIWLNDADADYAVLRYRILPPKSLHSLKLLAENLSNIGKLEVFCGQDFFHSTHS